MPKTEKQKERTKLRKKKNYLKHRDKYVEAAKKRKRKKRATLNGRIDERLKTIKYRCSRKGLKFDLDEKC